MPRALGVLVGLLLVLASALGPAGVAAKPLPVLITVTTTSDDVSPADHGCSLRAAILASNGNTAGYCGTGTLGGDAIAFSLGSGVPVINVGSELPNITNGVSIDGHTGGATRIEIHGYGAGHGLYIEAAASYTVVRSLVVDNFHTGIASYADYVTVAGNILGPNTAFGLGATGSTTIGGTNGITVGGSCTGDCNVISGNGTTGLYLGGGGTVVGNYIGTTRDGATANPNGVGITASGGWTIGDGTPAARNIVSGNAGAGMTLYSCSSCVIAGNFIGTDVTGKVALANGGSGIASSSDSMMTLTGNLISGNTGDGVRLAGSSQPTIQGNRIGTKNGGGSLGNGGSGIFLTGDGGGVTNALIGSPTDSSAANTIANNGGAGVRIGGTSYGNEMRRNSIHDNAGAGISLDGPYAPNHGIQRPYINGIGPVHGVVACTGCAVDVYSDTTDEGRIFEGTTTADSSGNWSFPGSVAGPYVTATATNSAGDTSAFAAPVSSNLPKPDGRIRKGSGSFIGNNIYNETGLNQTKTGSTSPGSTIKFGILDSERRDRGRQVHGRGERRWQYVRIHREVLPRDDRDHRCRCGRHLCRLRPWARVRRS